jgi:squalene synthase HpnC
MQISNPWTGVDHYENFPVASRLVPASLRPAVIALYRFARHADDLADEGELSPEERLSALQELREALKNGPTSSEGTPPVIRALWPHIEAHRLPIDPLVDLLSAFEQDARGFDFQTRGQLLDYCRRSANPVGRLLLHLFGVKADQQMLARSDAICSALQVINFIQDLGVDLARNRRYLPLERLVTEGLDVAALAAALQVQQATPALRQVIAAEAQWARSMMREGAPLAGQVPWRFGLELRAIIAGGMRLLELIESGGYDPIRARPKLSARDAPALIRLFLGAGR